MTRGDAAPPGTPGEVLAREGDALAADGEFEAALFKYDEALREDELVNRHHPRVAMRYCSVGALNRASKAEGPIAARARALGLDAIHRITPLRHQLMKLGLGIR